MVIAKQEIKVTEMEKQNAELETKRKKSALELKQFDEKLSKHENQLKQAESARASAEALLKKEKERIDKLEKELNAEQKEKTRWETKVGDLDGDLTALRKKLHTENTAHEKEIASLKAARNATPSKKLDELKKQNNELIAQCEIDARKLAEITGKYEQLGEEHVFMKAKLTSDKESLETSNATLKGKISALELQLDVSKRDNIDLTRKISNIQNKQKDLEGKSSQNSVLEHERKRLQASLDEKYQQYEQLARENEMNKDLSMQWKKEVVFGYRQENKIIIYTLNFCIF